MPQLAIKILSDVQSDLGDLAKSFVQGGEYIDFLNDVLHDVASETETWVARYTGTPVQLPNITPTNQVFIPYKNANNEVIAPYRILRVVRVYDNQTLETREYSIQTIQATGAGNYSFSGNWNIVNASSVATQRDSTDGFVLTFSYPIQLDETVMIDFITAHPYDLDVWDSKLISGKVKSDVSLAIKQDASNQGQTVQTIIPDFLTNSVKYGMLVKALERSFFSGNMVAQQRLIYAKQMYEQEIRKARYHSKMPKDNQGMIQLQAHNFLPEY